MRLLLNLVGVSLLVASAYACGAQETRFTRDGFSFKERTHQKYTVDGAGTLTVDADFGSIRVESWSNDEVDVEIEKRRTGISEDSARDAFRDVAVDISQQENDVNVRIDRDRNYGFDNVSLDIRVRLPESYSLDLKTSGGDITVGSTDGEVTVRTSGGDIEIDQAGGNTEATTSGGDIRIGHTTGEVTAKTSGGDITIERANGAVDVHTSGGDVTIDSAEGSLKAGTSGGDIAIGNATDGGVTATTSGGDIEARLRATVNALEEDWLLQSSGGELTIQIPEDLPATLEAEIHLERSWFGRDKEYRIDSDFDLEEKDDKSHRRH